MYSKRGMRRRQFEATYFYRTDGLQVVVSTYFESLRVEPESGVAEGVERDKLIRQHRQQFMTVISHQAKAHLALSHTPLPLACKTQKATPGTSASGQGWNYSEHGPNAETLNKASDFRFLNKKASDKGIRGGEGAPDAQEV
jgi:hypothetical protein